MTDARVADRMARTLAESGVEVIFGLPGGTISPLFDAIANHKEMRVVITKSEHGAITAASTYARHSGKVGVVVVTSGPGVLNALNGLASAQREGIPLVLIGGDVARAAVGRNAAQDGSVYGMHMAAVAKPLCAAVFDVARPSIADASLRRALAIAASPRGNAVYVNLPMDIGLAVDEPTERVAPVATFDTSRRFDDQALTRVASALASAKQPLIIVGNGARDKSAADIVTLAERYGVPVATTPKGKGIFPEDHALALGVYGLGGHRSASAYVEAGVDVLLVLGSSMNDTSTHGWNAKLQAPLLVQVDIDPMQIGRNYTAHLGFEGRVHDFVEALIARAPTEPRHAKHGVVYDTDAATFTAAPELIAPQRAVYELQRALPSDCIFTCDIGEHFVFFMHYLKASLSDQVAVMSGHGSMGTAIASAVGIKLAKPKRPVAAFVGDGGFMMSLTDLNTAAQERLPIVVAVINDFRYGMVELGHKKVYGRDVKYPVAPLDVSKLAEGCGATAVRVHAPSDIARIDFAERLRNGPLVLDIRIDPAIGMTRVDRFEKRPG